MSEKQTKIIPLVPDTYKQVLALYTTDCLICTALCDSGTKEFTKCHYTAGNKDCPASDIKLSVVGHAKRLARKVLAARNKRDVKREAKLLSYVGKQSEAFRSRFYDFLEGGI